MYSTDKLNEIIDDYLNICRGHPTKRGLSIALGTSITTVYNVIRGDYNHVPYGLQPSPTRVIDNCDFEIVRSVFTKPYG